MESLKLSSSLNPDTINIPASHNIATGQYAVLSINGNSVLVKACVRECGGISKWLTGELGIDEVAKGTVDGIKSEGVASSVTVAPRRHSDLVLWRSMEAERLSDVLKRQLNVVKMDCIIPIRIAGAWRSVVIMRIEGGNVITGETHINIQRDLAQPLKGVSDPIVSNLVDLWAANSVRITLCGPAGADKSRIVREAAEIAGQAVVRLGSWRLMSMMPAQRTSAIAAAVSLCDRASPAVLLLEHADALSDDAVRSLGKAIYVATATDASSVPLVSSHVLTIPMPTLSQRIALAQPLCEAETVGHITAGWSHEDVLRLCRAVCVMGLSRARQSVRPSLHEWLREGATDVTWDDVAGYNDVRDVLSNMVLRPILHPHAASRLGITAASGVLIHGPSGCGKTLIVKAMASAVTLPVLMVDGPRLFSKWLGEAEANVRRLFSRARAVAPCLVVIDEVDAIGGVRDGDEAGVEQRVIGQLLSEMDGVQQSHGVMMIGCTSRPAAVDPALKRPGRLEKQVSIDLPNHGDRAAAFKHHMRHVSSTIDYDHIGSITQGLSGADIVAVCREAALLGKGHVTTDHVITSLQHV